MRSIQATVLADALTDVTLVDVSVEQDRLALTPGTEKALVTIGRPPGESHGDLHREIDASVDGQVDHELSVEIRVTSLINR